MRNKLITLSYIFDGDIGKMNHAIKCDIEVSINYSFIKSLKSKGIKTITILDENYPKRLLELYDPPLVIYTIGNINLLNKKMSAIIGARKNLEYSKNVCFSLISKLSCESVVLSGLAAGIDSIAHQYAIDRKLDTIAVLGGGFDNIYPKENVDLANEIKENHLLLSEYPPNTRPTKRFFPLRNRIIAGLCSDIYVIEAALKSGSLITANIALELGRNIYCAPGSIFEKQYSGSHRLINDGAFLLELGNEVEL